MVIHKLLPFHKLLQGVSPTGSQALPANLLQCGLLSLHGSTGPGRSLPQRRVPMGSQSGGHPPAPVCGPFHRLQVDLCSTVNLHGLQGHSLPHHGLLHGLQGNLCSGAWSMSSSSCFTDLGVFRVVSHTLTPLFQVLLGSIFFAFLNTLSRMRYHRC